MGLNKLFVIFNSIIEKNYLKTNKMAQYKLMYFDVMGRAELARMCFAQAGVAFTDDRFSFEEWPAKKEPTPFGQVPVLYINDKPLPQSGAITRYLANEFGLMGENNMEAAYIDMIVETLQDMFKNMPFMEKDPEVKAKKEKEIFEGTIVPYLTKMEKKFSAADNKDFLVGSKVSLADIAMMHAGSQLKKKAPTVFDNFPTLGALVEKIAALPNIAKYIAARKETPF